MNAKPNFLLFGVQPKNWMLILPFSNIIDSAECDWMIFGRMTNSVWFSAKRWTMEKILANDRYCRLTFSTERHSAIWYSAIWPVLSLFSSRFCRMVILPNEMFCQSTILPNGCSDFQLILPYGILPNDLFCRSTILRFSILPNGWSGFCHTVFCQTYYSADRFSAKHFSA